MRVSLRCSSKPVLSSAISFMVAHLEPEFVDNALCVRSAIQLLIDDFAGDAELHAKLRELFDEDTDELEWTIFYMRQHERYIANYEHLPARAIMPESHTWLKPDFEPEQDAASENVLV